MIKFLGDGHLLTFDSVTDALRAGWRIQERVAEHNRSIAETLQFHVRIGLDAGDVDEDSTGDVRGHAADMAKRVESLGEAGRVLFTHRVLGVLPPGLAHWEFTLTYAPGALESVMEATRGQPFLTQAVAFDLVQLLNEHERTEATVADVERAIVRAVESSGEYLAYVWSDAGTEGQAILRAVAAGDARPDVSNRYRWLLAHDVLGEDGRFLVPMMERWVRTKIAGVPNPR